MATERNCQGHCSVERPTPQFAQATHSVSPVCRRSRGQPMLGGLGVSQRLPRCICIMLTVKELSAWLNIKESTLYLWASQNKIPCRRIHGLVRFEPEAIQAWLKGFEATPSQPPPADSPRYPTT
jgi:excisionase family DNA binding protein